MRCPMSVVVVVLLANAFLRGAAQAQGRFDFNAVPGMLRKTVIPQAYRIDIVPDLTRLTFTGHAAIDVDVRASAAAIVLNQAGLTLRSAMRENVAVADISEAEQRQPATLSFARPVTAGRHALTIDYDGPIAASPS